MTVPTMAPPLLWIGLFFWVQGSWAQTITVDEFSAFAVEQYQDCAADWDRKTPRPKTATDYAHPGAPIGAVITGFRGSGPERKRFARFTNCYMGALESKRAENEREMESRNSQLLDMCQVYRCESPEWMAKCNALLPEDFPPISCASKRQEVSRPLPVAPRQPVHENITYCSDVSKGDWDDRICRSQPNGDILATRIGDS